MQDKSSLAALKPLVFAALLLLLIAAVLLAMKQGAPDVPADAVYVSAQLEGL